MNVDLNKSDKMEGIKKVVKNSSNIEEIRGIALSLISVLERSKSDYEKGKAESTDDDIQEGISISENRHQTE